MRFAIKNARRSASSTPAVSRAIAAFSSGWFRESESCFQSERLPDFAISKIFPVRMPWVTNPNLSMSENSVGSRPSMNLEVIFSSSAAVGSPGFSGRRAFAYSKAVL